MKYLLSNYKKYWITIVIIAVLLILQAVCELSLPNYTSKLIDVGISSSGIEYVTPEEISAEDYAAASYFMLDDEKELWESSYEQDGDTYYLTDSAMEDMEALDDEFEVPLAIVYLISQMDEETLEEMIGDSVQGIDISSLTESQQAELITEMRSEIDEQLESLGESMIHSFAIEYTLEVYDDLGIDTDSTQKDYLLSTGGTMLMMAFGMMLCAVFVGFFASRTGAAIGSELRRKIYSKVLSFSSAEFSQFSTASLITRSTNDIQQVQLVSTLFLRMILYSPILAIGGIYMAANTGAGMTYVIIIAVVVLFCIVGTLLIFAMPKFKSMQKLVDGVNLISREILTGLFVIRAFSREKREEERFEDANQKLTRVMLFVNRLMSSMMPLMMLLMYGTTAVIVWVAAYKIDDGMLAVGAMTAFITYTLLIVISFVILTVLAIIVPRAAVAAERINEVLTTDILIQDHEDAAELNKDDVKGIIKFEHVYFKYPDAESDVIQDIDFTALPGQTTAIIGSTGCGKSTVVNLIPRFYDVTGGAIKIDGVDIRKYSQKSLRRTIGYVPQKGVLFSGDIESNILYGAPDSSEEEMKSSAEIAQAAEFIENKTENYKTEISQGGTNVSGGQRQRLSIARAIARNPKIYIFDDSFSALDFKTDIALRTALGPKVKESTVLIVAQRISTVLKAEQIIVLEKGKVVGTGRHKDLMKNCEVYKQIAGSQLSEKELAESML